MSKFGFLKSNLEEKRESNIKWERDLIKVVSEDSSSRIIAVQRRLEPRKSKMGLWQ